MTLMSTQWHMAGLKIRKLSEKQTRGAISLGVTAGERSELKLLFSCLA